MLRRGPSTGTANSEQMRAQSPAAEPFAPRSRKPENRASSIRDDGDLERLTDPPPEQRHVRVHLVINLRILDVQVSACLSWADVADVFKALDDRTRRLILDGLAVRDGQTLFEICGLLAIRHGLGSSRQAISQHLAVLEDAGLVTTERRGRTKLHYFNREPLAVISRRWSTARKDTP